MSDVLKNSTNLNSAVSFAEMLDNDKKNIVIVNGDKGGTGKSILCLIIEYINQGKRVIILDLDMSNEDVIKSCGNVHFKQRIDATLEGGWSVIDEIVHSKDFDLCIINTPAQIGAAIEAYGQHWIAETNARDEFNLITVWSLGASRDSTLLLRKYLEFNTAEPVFVALSMHEVDHISDFEVFNEKQSGNNPFDLRGGSVFKMLKLPRKLINRIKDGARNEETGQIERYSIQMFLDKYSNGVAGSFIKRPVLAAIEQMRTELGYVVNKSETKDNLDE